MLTSKATPLTLFVVWCLICSRWYVCEIKEACTQTPVEKPVIEQVETPAIETDTAAITPVTAESEPPTAKNKSLPPSTSNSFSAGATDRVQLETVEDYMVIHFPYNSIRKEDNDAINEYLTQLAANLKASGERVTITGHTDFVGDSKSNVQFGLKRAESIKAILVKKGVPATQIKCKSFGDAKPIATNDTPQGRYKNRRVEIRVAK